MTCAAVLLSLLQKECKYRSSLLFLVVAFREQIPLKIYYIPHKIHKNHFSLMIISLFKENNLFVDLFVCNKLLRIIA